MFMTKSTSNTGQNRHGDAQSASDVGRYLHPAPYALTPRELWTGLVIFFAMGIAIGVLGFAIIFSLH